MARRISVQAAIVLAALLVVACTAPQPTMAPTAVVHFRNLSGSALMVEVSSGDVQSLAVLRPCGGEASLAVAPPSADDPRVSMSAVHDATGNFDTLVAHEPAGTIDPDALGPVQFTAIIWSRGDIAYVDLPQWITFNAGTTDASRSAPTNTAPPRCDPWPNSE